jgi:hypothetical protein
MMQFAPSTPSGQRLTCIALEFFERRDLFLVSRESCRAFP